MIWKFSTYENLKLQSQVDSLQKQNAIFLEKEKVLQSQLENLQEERLLLLEREKIVQNQLNDQLAENQILQKRLSDTKINPKKENLENDLLAVLKVDVELEVPGSRSINSSTNTSEAKQIAIAKTDKYIEFTLDLSKIAYDKYIPRSIKILRYGEIENEVISEIKSIEILEKGKYIKVKAKTYKLKKGQYKLSLVGKGEESPKEEMGEYAFSIVRK